MSFVSQTMNLLSFIILIALATPIFPQLSEEEDYENTQVQIQKKSQLNYTNEDIQKIIENLSRAENRIRELEEKWERKWKEFDIDSWVTSPLKGDPGAPGSPGSAGPQGEKGVAGQKGEKGMGGIPGAAGVNGDRGRRGPEGLRGPPGLTGLNGEKGERGEKGDVGPTGPRGPTGERGLKGDQGVKGESGEPGEMGEPGMKGDTGRVGPRGLPGPEGPVGPKGEAAKFEPPDVDVFLHNQQNMNGEFVIYNAAKNGSCVPLNISVKSVNTHDTCILLYSEPHCRGQEVKFSAGSDRHHDVLTLFDLGALPKSVGPCLGLQMGRRGERGADGLKGPPGPPPIPEGSNTGDTYLWSIQNVTAKLAASKLSNVPEFSGPFFHRRHGYKMRSYIYFNGKGDGLGKSIAIYVELLQGPYDPLQIWPFSHEVTFTLYDQNVIEASNFQRSVNPDDSLPFQQPGSDYSSSDGNHGFGFSSFLQHDQLPIRSFIKNDVMFVGIKVHSLDNLSDADFGTME